MRIVLACRRCGHERLVDRDELLAGTWKNQPCPACKARHNDREPDDAHQPDTAA